MAAEAGPWALADEFGPAKVVALHVPAAGLRAVVAVDNVACGPAIGGVRMAADASAEEAIRLARAMTWKNAAGGLPHGGGKSVIVADPRLPAAEKGPAIRAEAPAYDGAVDARGSAWTGCHLVQNIRRRPARLVGDGSPTVRPAGRCRRGGRRRYGRTKRPKYVQTSAVHGSDAHDL